MKKSLASLVIFMALAFCQSALAQTPAPDLKHFASQGLSFDYPATVELDDRSSQTGQHLVIQSKGHAQIMVVSRFTHITTAGELAAARREVVDGFVETIWQQMLQSDPNVSRTAAKIDVAGAQAPGVRLRAVLNNEPGNAEIYSLQLGSRMVLLSLIGSDKEIAASTPAWLAIRRSLKTQSTPLALGSSATAAGFLF